MSVDWLDAANVLCISWLLTVHIVFPLTTTHTLLHRDRIFRIPVNLFTWSNNSSGSVDLAVLLCQSPPIVASLNRHSVWSFGVSGVFLHLCFHVWHCFEVWISGVVTYLQYSTYQMLGGKPYPSNMMTVTRWKLVWTIASPFLSSLHNYISKRRSYHKFGVALCVLLL